MATLFNFGGAGKLVSKEDVPFHIPSTLYALLFIYTSLPTLVIFCFHFFFFVLRCGHPIGVSSVFPLGKITVSVLPGEWIGLGPTGWR